jgi:hypothetical protein
MRSLCPESYIREKENGPAQALSRERASGVRCHGHSRTAPADETCKSFPIGDQRSVLQGYKDGPPANSYRIVGRPIILRPLGLRVWTAGLSPDRQRTAVHCLVFPSCMQRVRKIFTTAYHPQTNGQVERYNRTILASLRGYVSKRQDDWDDFTSAITFAYNCRVHSSLGLPPFELALTRPPLHYPYSPFRERMNSPQPPSRGSSWNGSRRCACGQERTCIRHKNAKKRVMTGG